MAQGYFIENKVIVINRELTDLDLFVKKFLEILKKHTDYLVVSGFVSISTGRPRGTEDIDVIVPVMDENKFKNLFNYLQKNDFWCYNGDNAEEVHEYIKNLNSIRFADKGKIFPNIELVPFDKTKKAKSFEFNNPQKIRVGNFEFKIPPIEFEILYKEMVLKGKKDIEDARHLRTFFSDFIKKEKFEQYTPVILGEIQ